MQFNPFRCIRAVFWRKKRTKKTMQTPESFSLTCIPINLQFDDRFCCGKLTDVSHFHVKRTTIPSFIEKPFSFWREPVCVWERTWKMKCDTLWMKVVFLSYFSVVACWSTLISTNRCQTEYLFRFARNWVKPLSFLVYINRFVNKLHRGCMYARAFWTFARSVSFRSFESVHNLNP